MCLNSKIVQLQFYQKSRLRRMKFSADNDYCSRDRFFSREFSQTDRKVLFLFLIREKVLEILDRND